MEEEGAEELVCGLELRPSAQGVSSDQEAVCGLLDRELGCGPEADRMAHGVSVRGLSGASCSQFLGLLGASRGALRGVFGLVWDSLVSPWGLFGASWDNPGAS